MTQKSEYTRMNEKTKIFVKKSHVKLCSMCNVLRSFENEVLKYLIVENHIFLKINVEHQAFEQDFKQQILIMMKSF
jgi:hypothetical protein